MDLKVTGGVPPYTGALVAGVLPGGLSIRGGPAAVYIEGTPTSVGASTVQIEVKDSAGDAQTVSVAIDILPNLPSFAQSTTMLEAFVGVNFVHRMASTCPLAPCRFWVSNGSLPAGLTIDSATGVITGIPTTAGESFFYLTIEDSSKGWTAALVSIFVRLPAGAQAGAITLRSAIANFQYFILLDERLAAAQYMWLLAGGTIPPGLTLSAYGQLQGIPTRPGAYAFKATATSSSGADTSTREYIITVTTTEIATTGLPNASRGVRYAHKLEARNGLPPYTWAVTSGSVPSGLELTEAGEIQGTPDTLGTSTFQVRAKDGVNNAATGTFTLLVERPVDPLAMATTSLAEAQAGVAYRFSLRASGGRPPYTFLLASSSLPLGLALSGSGELTGIPTRVGPFTFSVQVVDSGGATITKLFTLQVNQPTPAIKDGGVLNAASLQPGIAPEAWVSIFGQNLAPAEANRAWRDSDFVSGELPVSLENTQVRIAGQPAFVQYVSPTQLNVLVPPTEARGTAEVVVTTPTGSVHTTTRIDSVAPALFAATGLAAGLHAAAVHADGTTVGNPLVAASTRAARAGDWILLFGTGFGATNPDQRPSLAMSPAPLAAPFAVLIGGVNAEVDFGGVVGPGLYQFNARVPEVAAGEQPVVIQIGGKQSQDGVTLHVAP